MTDKRFATLRAELALVGYTLVRCIGDHGGPLFIVSKRERIEHLASLAELEQFVERHYRKRAPL